jgi:predicted flavoprotein YhiN
LIYSVFAQVRDEIEAKGSAVIKLDLAPGMSLQQLIERLSQPRDRGHFPAILRKQHI